MLAVTHRRTGFSMKQLLIVIGIIATSLGISIPFVQEARERSQRTQSMNNLKHICLATHSFHDAFKRLPFNGSNITVKGPKGDVEYFLEPKQATFTSGSWYFQISSYMDSGPTFQIAQCNSGIAALMCPGRGRPMTIGNPDVSPITPPWSDYVINPWLNDPKGGGGITTMSLVKDNRVRLTDIADGTANTIFFGHGQINTDDYTSTDSICGYMDTILIGGTTATALSSNPAAGPVTFARDSRQTRRNAARGWGSPFAQGSLMAMGDATVRMFPYTMPVGTFNHGRGTPGSLAAFLTPAGGEVVVLPDT